jgi:cytoskeletal protein CcmA (bactofilin family)
MNAAQPAAKKDVKKPSVPSIISSGLFVSGNLLAEGDLQVDGRVQGDVRATSVVVGEQAVVQGDIIAEEAIIRGRVDGGIRARKLQLCAKTRVNGNVVYEALSVETGAVFQGNCRYSDNPLVDVPDIQTAMRLVAEGPPAVAELGKTAKIAAE